MAREKDLQKWFVEKAKKQALISAIEDSARRPHGWGDWEPPADAGLDLSDPLTAGAVEGINTVLRSLCEAEFISADSDLALVPGVRFRPDLLLHDRAMSGAFIIVELKAHKNAARQAVTELLAYAEGLQRKFPEHPIHLLIASQSWPALLDHAVVGHWRGGRLPLLPLDVDAVHGDDGSVKDYRLAIRWALCDVERGLPVIEPYALACDIRAFHFHDFGRTAWRDQDRVERAIIERAHKLAAGADAARTGFILVWRVFRGGPVWHVATFVANGARLSADLPENSPLHRNHNRPDLREQSQIDYGWRLLRKLDVQDLGLDDEQSGYDNWSEAQRALCDDGAQFLFAAGWGKTSALFEAPDDGSENAATNLDPRRFAGHHPFNFIPRLDRLTGSDFRADDLSSLESLYRLGAIAGAVTYYYAHRPVELSDTAHFDFLASTARLVATWTEVCKRYPEAAQGNAVPPRLRFEEDDGTQLFIRCIDILNHWCRQELCRASVWHRFAYELGYAHAFAARSAHPSYLGEVGNRRVDGFADELVRWAAAAPEMLAEPFAEQLLDHVLYLLDGRQRIAPQDLASPVLCECLVELADFAAAVPGSAARVGEGEVTERVA